MRQLLVAVASNRSPSSTMRASASAVRLPRCVTVPMQRTVPDSAVMARRNFTDRSSVV